MKMLREDYDAFDVFNSYTEDNVTEVINEKVGYLISGAPLVSDPSLANDFLNFMRQRDPEEYTKWGDEEILEETYYLQFDNRIKDDVIVQWVLTSAASEIRCKNVYGPFQRSGAVIYIFQR